MHNIGLSCEYLVGNIETDTIRWLRWDFSLKRVNIPIINHLGKRPGGESLDCWREHCPSVPLLYQQVHLSPDTDGGVEEFLCGRDHVWPCGGRWDRATV